MRKHRLTSAFLALLLLAVLSACGGHQAPAAAIDPGTTGTVDLGDRPFQLAVPRGYDPGRPAPLVLALHGYTQTGSWFASWSGLTAEYGDKGFLLAFPDGLTDSHGQQFWNATSACCDFDGKDVDDSAYLSNVISTIEKQYAVDPARVFVVGHSNGGFMALRMACDHADQVAAAVSISGDMADDPAGCTPSRKVSVLQLQGDQDESIHYDGGLGGTGKPYPGAQETVADWRALDGCADAATTDAPLDLEASLTGAETTRTTWSSCADGTEVALWTIVGGHHVPRWTPAIGPTLADWMLAHPRTS